MRFGDCHGRHPSYFQYSVHCELPSKGERHTTGVPVIGIGFSEPSRAREEIVSVFTLNQHHKLNDFNSTPQRVSYRNDY